jgi:hypothetical protein
MDGGSAGVRIPWDEVSSIEEKRVGQRIEIHGRKGDSIRVGYHLRGFQEFLQVLLASSNPVATASASESVEFHPSLGSSLILMSPVLTFFGAGAIAAFRIAPIFPPGLGLAAGISLVLFLLWFLLLTLISRVRIEEDRIVARGIWAMQVPLSEIESVSLHMWGERGTQVVIRPMSGRKRFLPPVREGSFALYRALRSRLEPAFSSPQPPASGRRPPAHGRPTTGA